ncbi:MAG: threonine synthase [SAR86 cluster bacterium]|jgi:threonine synthase|nr:threonine synthase [SAR86 cluster bacterium]MBL6822264.1 threonine synthase [SAR86 cluster bacterium]MDA8781059.1 threonine synthase [Gammaproteobacteria bacterium]MDB2411072.1 threonine synthase [Gammaproteobacteria bacterium]MDC0919523.1 threonine synthase [Gammaproteobacteria bacterium]
MLFHSTRGKDTDKDFASILMQGLADDGGLFMPDYWPQVDLDEIKSKTSFVDIAKCIVPLFTSSSFSHEETTSMVESTWHDFEHQDLIGIKEFNSVSILELFHGPTAAFKDFGLQLAAAFFNKVLESENKTAIVLGATSGDTGSAAIDACKNYGRIKSFILLPNGNMSEVQRRQMSTIKASNVFALRIDGTFDDCQDLVKLAFKKRDFLNNDQYLLAVNSINWTRIIGQICYYFYAFNQLHQKSNLNFSIPTGNFGNVFACYSAHKMGLPINNISVAVNENDILHRFFSDNNYSKQFVHETISPSMDISVASNFERLVYDLFLDRDSARCSKMFDNFPTNPIELDSITWQKKDRLFSSSKVNDLDTKKIIQETYKLFNYILDPHTAVAAVEAFNKSDENNHYVVLSTAHPAKFPQVYEELDIEINSLPFALRDLFKKEEYLHSFDADYNQIVNFINRNN